MTQLSQAIAQGQLGLSNAVAHSDEDTPGWKNAAISFLHRYCETHETVFPESVWRQYAGMGFAEPAELRAYGALTKHAKKQKWLSDVSHGTQQRVHGHGSHGPVWLSLIYRGTAMVVA